MTARKEMQGALPSAAREKGQRRMRCFMVLNAVPVACLMESVVILYALRNGLSDPLVAVLASFMHLAMPFMILGKRLVARFGLARTWSSCWAARYVVGSTMIAAPLFHPVAAWLVAGILIFGYLGLMAFRSMGLIAVTPLVGEITTARDRGRFISQYSMLTNISYVLCMVAIIWILRRWDRMVTYQSIIAIGCGVGLLGAYVLSTIPESSRPRVSAGLPMADIFRKMIRPGPYRKLLLAWCAGFASFALIVPFIILAVKNAYGISDYAALSYAVLLLLGSIIAAFVNGIIADHVGPRPLVVLYIAGFFVVCLAWALAPAVLVPWLIGAAFFVAGFCKQGMLAGLGHYFLSLVSEDERVGAGLFVRMFSGAAAGAAGALLGGGLLRLLGMIDLSTMDLYRWYFRIMLIVLVPLLVTMHNLPRLREWSIRDVLGLVLAPSDLRAMAALNRLRASADYRQDLSDVRRLGNISSDLSESALLEYLQSAHLSVRVRALRALARHAQLSDAACKAIRRQLEEGEYTTAWIAAEVLGEKRVRDAVPELRQALESDDVFLTGKVMQALVQLNDRPSFARIVDLFRQTNNPRLVIHGAHALGLMGDAAHIPVLLEKAVAQDLPAPVCDEVLSAAAGLVGQGENLYRLLKEWRTNPAEVPHALADVLPGVLTEHDVRSLLRDGAAEDRVVLLRRAMRHRRRGALLPDAEILRILQESQRRGVVDKVVLCLCLLLLSEPSRAGQDGFLQIL